MNKRKLLFTQIDRTAFYTMEIDDKFHLVLSHIHKCMRCKFITGLYYKSITMNEIIADDISIKLPFCESHEPPGAIFSPATFPWSELQMSRKPREANVQLV